MILGLHHIAILCSDKQRALAFYRDGLGFSVAEMHVRSERGDEIMMLVGYGVTLELFVVSDRPPRVSDPEAYGLRHLALKVSCVETICEHLRAYGFCPEPIRRDSFTGEKMTFVKDPDDLPIELHE